MAALTPDQLLKVLQAEGVKLCPDCLKSDWRTLTRPGDFDPVGIVVHHTASNTTSTSLIRNGRSDLAGPLANFHLTRDGVLHLVSAGKCNHAGKCDGDVVAAMKAGRPAPAPDEDTVVLNGLAYGFECNGEADGQPFTPAMTDTLIRAITAISRAKGWNANHTVAHKEATRRKPQDPSGIRMSELRDAVSKRLSSQKATTAAKYRTVTVKKGQTLSAIAAAAAVTVGAVMAVNPQIHDANKIQPGDVVTIPPSASATAKPAPKPTAKVTPTSTAKPTSTPVRVTPKPTPKPTAKPAPAPAAKPAPTLRRGDKGADVRDLQRRLGLRVDGDFGPKTEKAVKAFQRKHKLRADGVVGPKTWAALGR